MNITPVTSYISPIGTTGGSQNESANVERKGSPSFLDVFTQIFGDAVESNQTVSDDRIRMMLGDADDLEQIQLNLHKAKLTTELFANVRNTVLESYNEIIRMQI